MYANIHPGFLEMDRLSQLKTPFFFMVNYDRTEVKVVLHDELEREGLYFDFEGDKHPPQVFGKEFYWKPEFETIESYAAGFNHILQEIRSGNTYLINYTRETKVRTDLTLSEIYGIARAKYKILYNNHFVCFSPETFVTISDGKIHTFPMKGTIDAAIPDAESRLKNDVKEKAEHYTVVDLLRNDLSMVADKVNVEAFQQVHRIRTKQKDLLAMSSVISGIIKQQYLGRVGTIMHHLLPAGSILGAPKIKTMQIISKSEGYARGWYTGVGGFFDGESLNSCVMIRFIEKKNDSIYYKSGGGITHMSTLEKEYEEMKSKVYVPVY